MVSMVFKVNWTWLYYVICNRVTDIRISGIYRHPRNTTQIRCNLCLKRCCFRASVTARTAVVTLSWVSWSTTVCRDITPTTSTFTTAVRRTTLPVTKRQLVRSVSVTLSCYVESLDRDSVVWFRPNDNFIIQIHLSRQARPFTESINTQFCLW